MFKRVVLIEYPKKGVYALGFLTNDSSLTIDEATGKHILSIFVPSSPGPLTGFTLFVPEEEVIFLDITIEEAMRLIVSGGMITPGERPPNDV